MDYCLPEWLRMRLRTPLPGSMLYPDPPMDLLETRDVVVVGDVVSRRILELGYKPRMIIIDCYSMRMPVECHIPQEDYIVLMADNPPSRISESLRKAIDEGIELIKEGNRVVILVRGEEDLATLYLAYRLPRDYIVVYGQPLLGVVVFEVNDLVKHISATLLASMTECTL